MKTPTISVCVPVYNGASYLDQCIESILNQSFQDFELIFVDDCSTDESIALIESYRRNDPRVKLYLNEKNLGLVNNWNKCISLAEGKWVKFVFQDDIITPDCLEKMIAAADKNRAFVFSRRKIKVEKNIPDRVNHWFETHQSVVIQHFRGKRNITPEEFTKAVIQKPTMNIIGEPTAVMIARDAFYEMGLFNPELVQLCDFEYWVRIICQKGAVFIDEELATFRVHGSATSVLNKKRARARLDGVIFLYHLTFSPKFKNFRKLCSAQLPFPKLVRLLRSKARSSYFYLRYYGELSAWESLIEEYPLIERLLGNPDFVYHGIRNKKRLKVLLKKLVEKLRREEKNISPNLTQK